MLPPTRSNEGYRLLNLGQLAEAEAEFKAALQNDPKDVKCLLGLARVQLATQAVEEGLQTVTQVFALKPDHLEAKSLRGLLLIEKGDIKGVKDLEDAAKDRRSGPQEHLNYGLYLATRDDAKAQKEFELALRSDARNMRAHLELGKIAERKNDMRSALVHWQKACEFAPATDGTPFLLKARAHKGLGESSAASAAIVQAVERAPEGRRAEIVGEAFRLAMDVNDPESSLKIALMALELDSSSSEYQGWMMEARAAAQKSGGARPKAAGTTELWKEETPKTGGKMNKPALGAAPPSPTGSNLANLDAGPPKPVDVELANKHALQYLFKKPPMLDDVLRVIEPALRVRPDDGRANISKAIALALKGDFANSLPCAQKAAQNPDPAIKMEAKALITVCERKLANK